MPNIIRTENNSEAQADEEILCERPSDISLFSAGNDQDLRLEYLRWVVSCISAKYLCLNYVQIIFSNVVPNSVDEDINDAVAGEKQYVLSRFLRWVVSSYQHNMPDLCYVMLL